MRSPLVVPVRTDSTLHSQEWDTLRSQRSDALDSVLESLGSQYVPPDFHTVSVDSSPFGSQNGSEDENEDDGTPFGLPKSTSDPRQSPTDTIRTRSPLAKLDEKKSKRMDRRRWKTLSDFVDERAIEDLLDTIETDRQGLDVGPRHLTVSLCVNHAFIRIFLLKQATILNIC